MKNNLRRILSVLISLQMILSISLPGFVFANNYDENAIGESNSDAYTTEAIDDVVTSNELANSEEFVIENGVLIGWNQAEDFDGNLVLPEDITEIGDQVFQGKGITTVQFNDELRKIGNYAFADNNISNINFNNVTTIGDSAFQNNIIKELNTLNIEEIGKSAFQNNEISDLTFGSSLKTISDYAFNYNDISDVNISNNVTSFGTHVFTNNRKYVRVSSDNPVVNEERVSGQFGHVLNTVIITVEHLDENGNKLIDDIVLGEDLSIEGNAYIINETREYQAPEISGYILNSDTNFTPNTENYNFQVIYKKTDENPTLVYEGEVKKYALGENPTSEQLLEGVSATDLLGRDISDSIEITSWPQGEGESSVTYSVTDEWGNTSTLTKPVLMGIDYKDFEVGNGWVVGDFTYNDNVVTGFSEQGLEKFALNKNLVLPTINLQGENVDTVGASAFFDKKFNGLTIPEGYVSLNNSAFGQNLGASIGSMGDIRLPESLLYIGDRAFQMAGVTSLDIPENSKIQSLGTYAFYGNSIGGEVHLPQTVNSLGDGVFQRNKIEVFTMPDNFTKIPKEFLNQNQLTSIEIGSKVTSIGSNAFSSNLLTELNLHEGITQIGHNGFSRNRITELVIPESLKIIENNTFSSNRLTKVDFHDGIISIGSGAFASNDLRNIEVPPLIKRLEYRVFFGNVRLETLTLPEGLEYIGVEAFREVKTLRSVEIPSTVKTIERLAFYDAGLTGTLIIPEGVESIGEESFRANRIDEVIFEGETLTSIGPRAFYTNYIQTAQIPISLESLADDAFENQREGNVVINPIILTTKDWSNPNNLKRITDFHTLNPIKLTIRHLDENGNELLTKRVVDTMGATTYTIEEIPYIPGYITPESPVIELTEAAQEVELVYIKENTQELRDAAEDLNFRQSLATPEVDRYLIGNSMVSFVEFAISEEHLKYGVDKIVLSYNPDVFDVENMPVPTSEFIRSVSFEDGQMIIDLIELQSGTSANIPIAWQFKELVTPEDTPYEISAHLIGGDGDIIAETDNVSFTGYYRDPFIRKDLYKIDRTEAYFDFQTNSEGGVNDDTVLEYRFSMGDANRYYNHMKVVDTLPSYQDVDGNVRIAVFDPELNPLWTLSEDGRTVSYEINTITTTKSVIPPLKLRYPNAKSYSNIINEVMAEFTAIDEFDNENKMISRANELHFFAPRIRGGGSFDKRVFTPRRLLDQTYMYDIRSDRERDIIWNLFIKSETFDGNQITLIDENLDERLYYSAIEIPESLAYSKLNTYDSEGALISSIDINRAGTYAFDNQDISKIELIGVFNATEEISVDGVNIITKHRNLEEDYFDPEPFAENILKNTAKLYSGDLIYSADAEVEIKDYSEIISALKTRTGKQTEYPGDKGQYHIGVKRVSTILSETMTDFVLIDIVPNEVDIENIRLRDDFAEEGTFEIIDNYNNLGKVAIKFTHPNLQFISNGENSEMFIADLDYRIKDDTLSGIVTNNVYLKTSNTSINLGNTIQDASIDTDILSRAYDDLPVIRASELVARKYIRKDSDVFWNSTGITTKSLEEFQYKLSITNSTIQDKTGIVLADVFPHIGDTNLINETDGSRLDRNSEFENTFKSMEFVSEGYTVEYLNESIPSFDDFSVEQNNWNWEDTQGDKVHAIRISQDPGVVLEPGETFEAIINMQAPENSDYRLSEKRAINTNVRTDSGINNFLEMNAVYNEMAIPQGFVEFTKKGYDFSNGPAQKINLEGAIFELQTETGEHISYSSSDENGRVRIGLDDLRDNYIVKEYQAPEGYQLIDKEWKIIGREVEQMPNYTYDLGEVVNFRKWYPIELILGEVHITKVDANQAPLANISFKVRGLSKYNDHIELIDSTNAQGRLSFFDLPLGKYELTELNAPGFLQNIEPMEFNITSMEQKIDYTVVNNLAEFDLIKIGLTPEQIGQRDNLLEFINPNEGLRLQGAEFTLINDSDQEDVRVIETDENGHIKFTGLSVNQIYTLKESKAPDRYEEIFEEIKISVDSKGVMTIIDGENTYQLNRNSIIMPNKKSEELSNVEIIKKDKSGNILEGAEFKLTKMVDDGATQSEEYPKIAVSDSDGKVTFEELDFGTYQIEEVSAPKGYYRSPEIKTFTVDKYNGTTIKFEYINNPVEISASKVEFISRGLTSEEADSLINENSGLGYSKVANGNTFDVVKYLQGAEFELINTDTNEIVIEKIISDENGKIDIDVTQLSSNNNYGIRETKAPAGYKLNPTIRSINLKDRTLFNQDKLILNIANEKYKGTILVSKYDQAKNINLDGIDFAIYDQNNQYIETVTTEAGIASFRNLELGTYFVKEVKTQSGFRLPLNGGQQKVEITEQNAEGVVRLVFYNEPQILPVTGSYQAPITIVGLIALLFIGLKLNKRKDLT